MFSVRETWMFKWAIILTSFSFNRLHSIGLQYLKEGLSLKYVSRELLLQFLRNATLSYEHGNTMHGNRLNLYQRRMGNVLLGNDQRKRT